MGCRSRRARPFVSILVCVGTAAAAAAQGPPGPAAPAYSRSPQTVVAKLSIWSGEAHQLEPRSVAVYGDGRVLVRLPPHLRRAGEHEMRLAPAELDALVAALAASGLPEFDGPRVRAACRARERARGEVFATADADTIELELRLDGYRGADGRTRPLARRVVWTDLAMDRRRFPGIAELRGLADARDALAALLARPDLTAVR